MDRVHRARGQLIEECVTPDDLRLGLQDIDARLTLHESFRVYQRAMNRGLRQARSEPSGRCFLAGKHTFPVEGEASWRCSICQWPAVFRPFGRLGQGPK